MIELKKDGLSFSFPQVAESMRKLEKEYVQETLPKMLGEDRIAALDEVLTNAHRFRNATEADRVNMLRFTQNLTANEIEAEFQRKVRYQTRCNFTSNEPGQMTVAFQRTLRIPDDGKNYGLPPGLGRFPLRHIDDFADRLSPACLERGGVMMPMYQAEALWLSFSGGYPFAVKVASGKINAATGESWLPGLNRDPQDYLVLPEQPWLDGFAVEKGIIRQFVAMPLGAGYSVEEQLTGAADFGGVQIQAFPMKADAYFNKEIRPELPTRLAELLPDILPSTEYERNVKEATSPRLHCQSPILGAPSPMGLGAGGCMKQEIYEDPNDLDVWDTSDTSRCFVHLFNALQWREITGENPPNPPVTAKEYEHYGLPWFDFYRDDVAVLEGSKKLAEVKSVAILSKEKGDHAVIGNESVKADQVINCGPKERPDQVREWNETNQVFMKGNE